MLLHVIIQVQRAEKEDHCLVLQSGPTLNRVNDVTPFNYRRGFIGKDGVG